MNKEISEEMLFEGPRFNVVRKKYISDRDGKEYIRDCVNPGDAVVILTVENDEIIFIKQLREVVGTVELEFPAGMIDPGEEPIDAARRELEEETGLIAEKLEKLIEYYPSCGYSSEKIYIYLARDLKQGHIKFDDTEEIIDICRVPIEEAVKMVMGGEYRHASVSIAILMYYYRFIKGGSNE